MNAMRVLPVALSLSLLVHGLARAQRPTSSWEAGPALAQAPSGGEPLPAPTPFSPPSALPPSSPYQQPLYEVPGSGSPDGQPAGTLSPTGLQPGVLPPGAVASPWIFRPSGPCCGGLIGADGPIVEELYSRFGASIPFGGGIFGASLQTGWDTTVGGRTLFFNSEGTAAWAVDLSISYIYYNGSADAPVIPRFGQMVQVRGLHRTNFSFGLGRDWFLHAPGYNPSEPAVNWRFGTDVGGRWGTSHVDLNVPSDTAATPPDTGYARVQRVNGSFYLGLYSNLEFPRRSWLFLIGTRAEYDYTWCNILPDVITDMQSVNLQITAGVRF